MRKGEVQKILMQDYRTQSIFRDAAKYAFEYMGEVFDRPAFPESTALDNLSVFDEHLPEGPQDGREVLEMLNSCGSPATTAQTGGRYFGFVNGGAVPAGLAARWLADVWDQNAALYMISPIAGKLEGVCERWLKELLDLPGDTVAGLVGGTSLATLCGLAAGRYALLQGLGWDINEQGLGGAPRLRVVLSEQAHGTVFKALALLGVGRQNMEVIPADAHGRIDVERMPEVDSRTLLVLQAGNVNSGAFDAFEEIVPAASDAGAWIHVDGAFGLWARASRGKRDLVEGIEKADSWSVDGHKTLNTPYDCGIVLCRHPQQLIATMQASGAYIQYSEERDGMLYVPEMSRRARAIELWATLRNLGRSGVEQLVDGLCARAIEFAEMLHANNFDILNDVVFNQVLVSGNTDEETQHVLRSIQLSGECWCGGTVWQGRTAIRISVCSWATTNNDVRRSVEAFVEARRLYQQA